MDLGYMNVVLKLMHLYVGSVFKMRNVVLNVLTIWAKSGPFPRVFWMILFSTFWGARQAELLHPPFHSQYARVHTDLHQNLLFFHFSRLQPVDTHFFCPQAEVFYNVKKIFHNVKKMWLQPAEVDFLQKKIDLNRLKSDFWKTMDHGRLKSPCVNQCRLRPAEVDCW